MMKKYSFRFLHILFPAVIGLAICRFPLPKVVFVLLSAGFLVAICLFSWMRREAYSGFSVRAKHLIWFGILSVVLAAGFFLRNEILLLMAMLACLILFLWELFFRYFSAK